MKLYLLALTFMLSCAQISAQVNLTHSRQSGYYTYIYKLNDQEALTLVSQEKPVITDAMMHNLVDSVLVDRPVLNIKFPFGTYLYVTPKGGYFDYHIESVQNIRLIFVSNRNDFQFLITDTAGNEITDADVWAGRGRKIAYDATAGLYVGKASKRSRFITVNYKS
ncbi:MAG: hypothetical protein EOO88_28465, partial [Pedobacter sp.]